MSVETVILAVIAFGVWPPLIWAGRRSRQASERRMRNLNVRAAEVT